jgi:hypothetical protein
MKQSHSYNEIEISSEASINEAIGLVLPLTHYLREAYSPEALRGLLLPRTKVGLIRTYVGYTLCANDVSSFALFDIHKGDGEVMMHMRLVVVGPPYQSEGLYKMLLGYRIVRHAPTMLVGRFHNPRIYETLMTLEGSIYPDVLNPRRPIPPHIAGIMFRHAGTSQFDAKVGVARQVYSDAGQNRPEGRNAMVNQYYDHHVGHRDGLMVVVQLSKHADDGEA